MIKIYNSNLECLAVLVDTISIEWVRRFYDYGSFVLNLPINCPYLDVLQINNYIWHNDNIGIILYKEQTKDKIEIRGYDLKGLTSFRTCQGNKSGRVEKVIKDYATAELTAGNKKIPQLTVATNKNRGSNIETFVELEKLDKALKTICTENNIGYDIKKDENNLKFDVVIPTDRSGEVIFSRRFNNITNYNYTADDYDTITTVYNIADVDDTTSITEHYNEASAGLKRREGITKHNREPELALQEIAPTKESIEANTMNIPRYNIDWFLGDYVQIVVEAFGETISAKKQITEVQEIHERSRTIVIPTFGEKQEDLLKRVKGVL